MPQLLMFADPRPLVERLGADFFREAPTGPGVYMMRDSADAVVYVGKAKNLRRRLGSYRVANPERMARRHLRLLRVVRRIELEQCADEAGALAREAELLRALRPRFNRAGTWPGTPRLLMWRVSEDGLELGIARPGAGEGSHPDWQVHGPLGAGAEHLRAALLRLLWCVFQPVRGLAGLPQGWFGGRLPAVARIARGAVADAEFESANQHLRRFCTGEAEALRRWLEASMRPSSGPFESAVREADLETLSEFSAAAGK
ncbi:MAG TPA: nucleotide excision repair endonuclease [Verrucomicrobiae bacterium]|nr:nucleotide excision repair endonuclease [Verrucomicrobiae bacterium]